MGSREMTKMQGNHTNQLKKRDRHITAKTRAGEGDPKCKHLSVFFLSHAGRASKRGRREHIWKSVKAEEGKESENLENRTHRIQTEQK
jgi:hypothetical protein